VTTSRRAGPDSARRAGTRSGGGSRTDAAGGALSTYRRKRDFARTAEPRGARAGRAGEADPGPADGAAPSFVVQIHDARAVHFDFRLEVDGVLKSWAVPKGPSDDPHDKRLAVPTEDHPLEYREYEGTIAAGEYGAGTVIVWDQGSYRNLSRDRRSGAGVPFAEALERGHASFRLDGVKLHGGYALTRIPDRAGRGEVWLLVKQADGRAGHRGTPDPARARSVRTGRTLRQVAAEPSDDPGPGGGGA
jgi:DNA ligase D-like protein (predicted 3'-phosphoesterase)